LQKKGVVVPARGVVTILKEHVNWQRLNTCRGTPECRKYNLYKDKVNFTKNANISSLKMKANHRHELEKERMDTL